MQNLSSFNYCFDIFQYYFMLLYYFVPPRSCVAPANQIQSGNSCCFVSSMHQTFSKWTLCHLICLGYCLFVFYKINLVLNLIMHSSHFLLQQRKRQKAGQHEGTADGNLKNMLLLHQKLFTNAPKGDGGASEGIHYHVKYSSHLTSKASY